MALAELAMIVAYSNMSAMASFLFLKPLAELAKVQYEVKQDVFNNNIRFTLQNRSQIDSKNNQIYGHH